RRGAGLAEKDQPDLRQKRPPHGAVSAAAHRRDAVRAGKARQEVAAPAGRAADVLLGQPGRRVLSGDRAQGLTLRNAARLVTLVCALASGGAPRAAAARPVRHRFEPTDLEMEEPGVLDIDVQFGPVQGPSSSRLVAPDFELDLGIARHVELDVDGAYAFDEYDPVWLSLKLSVGWLGVQLGPKLPVGSQDGIGAEALVLASAHAGACTGVVNLGAFVDPAPAGASARPVAVQG